MNCSQINDLQSALLQCNAFQRARTQQQLTRRQLMTRCGVLSRKKSEKIFILQMTEKLRAGGRTATQAEKNEKMRSEEVE